jgi:hypothetical protein
MIFASTALIMIPGLPAQPEGREVAIFGSQRVEKNREVRGLSKPFNRCERQRARAAESIRPNHRSSAGDQAHARRNGRQAGRPPGRSGRNLLLVVDGQGPALTVQFHQNIKTKETAMSLPLVKITLVDPTVPERQFVFDRPRTCVVGRQYDCDIALPSDRAHREVSRHHCQLDINPPHVRVRDLNSRNGTFVNGKRLAPEGADQEDAGTEDHGTAVLSDGDEIRIAKSRFHVHVEENQEHLTTA